MKVAAIQLNSSAQVDKNLAAVRNLVNQAANEGAKLIVLPENFASMGMKESDHLEVREEFGIGKIQGFLKTLARSHKIWIVGGTIPIASHEDSKVYASSLLFDPQGECVARYDKIHLFDVKIPVSNEYYRESDTIQPGKDIKVANTPFARLGLSVCYDLRFPELYRKMLLVGLDIIVIPSAFTQLTGKAHWELLVRARAIENSCYVIAANQSGIHQNGRQTYGHSMIVDPWGEICAILPKGVGCLVAELDLEHQARIRENFPVINHRKL